MLCVPVAATHTIIYQQTYATCYRQHILFSKKKQNWQHKTLHTVLCADKLGNRNLGFRFGTNIRYEPRDSFRIRISRTCFYVPVAAACTIICHQTYATC
jgi:hypothetical protein